MTERTPDEIEAISRLSGQFMTSIAAAKGVDRQIVLDALEYTLWTLLTECFASKRELDWYLNAMRDRCHGMWNTHHEPGGA